MIYGIILLLQNLVLVTYTANIETILRKHSHYLGVRTSFLINFLPKDQLKPNEDV